MDRKQCQSLAMPQTVSFFELPREIRDQIYGLILRQLPDRPRGGWSKSMLLPKDYVNWTFDPDCHTVHDLNQRMRQRVQPNGLPDLLKVTSQFAAEVCEAVLRDDLPVTLELDMRTLQPKHCIGNSNPQFKASRLSTRRRMTSGQWSISRVGSDLMRIVSSVRLRFPPNSWTNNPRGVEVALHVLKPFLLHTCQQLIADAPRLRMIEIELFSNWCPTVHLTMIDTNPRVQCVDLVTMCGRPRYASSRMTPGIYRRNGPRVVFRLPPDRLNMWYGVDPQMSAAKTQAEVESRARLEHDIDRHTTHFPNAWVVAMLNFGESDDLEMIPLDYSHRSPGMGAGHLCACCEDW